jgi:hypothetical protein
MNFTQYVVVFSSLSGITVRGTRLAYDAIRVRRISSTGRASPRLRLPDGPARTTTLLLRWRLR